ncbi:MAG: STAS domain-containing protein [Planctomycetota bacterium]
MTSLAYRDQGNERWIELSGPLDFEGCEAVGGRFAAAASQATGDVVVDLRAVPFVASHGIRLLLQTHRILEGSGRRVKVSGLNPVVRKVFDTTGLFHAIPEV